MGVVFQQPARGSDSSDAHATLETAFAEAAKINDPEQHAFALSAIAKAQVHSGCVSDAKRTLKRAVGSLHKAKRRSDEVYLGIVDTLVKAGEIEGAKQLAKDEVGYYHYLSEYGTLIDLLRLTKDFREPEKAITSSAMGYSNPWDEGDNTPSEVLAHLAEAEAMSGVLQAARENIALGIVLSQPVRNVEVECVLALAAIAEVVAESGDIRSALEIYSMGNSLVEMLDKFENVVVSREAAEASGRPEVGRHLEGEFVEKLAARWKTYDDITMLKYRVQMALLYANLQIVLCDKNNQIDTKRLANELPSNVRDKIRSTREQQRRQAVRLRSLRDNRSQFASCVMEASRHCQSAYSTCVSLSMLCPRSAPTIARLLSEAVKRFWESYDQSRFQNQSAEARA